MTEGSVSYTDAVDILMRTLAIPDGRRASFESRIRHVQLVQAQAGREGKRIPYNLDEIALIAFAFALMGAHLPPRLAIRHIVERRSQTLRVLRVSVHRGDAIAVVPGNGLDAIGEGGQDAAVPLPRIAWFTNAEKATTTGSATLIGTGRMMAALTQFLAETNERNAQRRAEARLKRMEYCRAAARRSNAAKAAARQSTPG